MAHIPGTRQKSLQNKISKHEITIVIPFAVLASVNRGKSPVSDVECNKTNNGAKNQNHKMNMHIIRVLLAA